jgi:hypothetical protein
LLVNCLLSRGLEQKMVYLLEPKKYKWITFPKVPHELLDRQVKGNALQQSDIPAEATLKARFKLPDVCRPSQGFLFVSNRGRAVLEELAPGCVAFFPLNLNAPEHMLAERAYFFIDVLPRAQLIDWDQTPTGPRVVRAPDGRESRAIQGYIKTTSTKFKAVTPETSPIWREADFDRPTVHFFCNKLDVFLRDDLWEELNARLPGQLLATKFA